MKREGINTLFIHTYLWALSCLLDHFVLFENVLCVVFESILKRRHRLGKLYNGSRLIRTYTKCWTFLKIFHVLKVFGVCLQGFLF